ncbi:MAG: hypothetical protein ABI674_06195 [Spartobacteria bacterium]
MNTEQRGAGRKTLALLFCLLLSGTWSPARGASSTNLGLHVDGKGVLTRNGVPYRGIGVNYYDAFLRTLRNPNDDSYVSGFAKLGAHGIPFARMAAGAYLGKDFQLYLTDKDAYFRKLDAVVQAAEKSNVGLIASLFWTIAAVSDVVHEPRERWGDPKSQTRQFMRKYTQEVVSRYAKSPAIWGWEFSCELSLPVDQPPGKAYAERTLSLETFQSAALDFARVVRKIDPGRILLTGNSLPRVSAYHAATGGGFAADTEDQFGHVLLRDNPGPFSPICIHASPAGIERFFADRRVSYQGLLEACMRIGRSAGKPVYLEEFVPIPGRPGARRGMSEKDYFSSELAAIKGSGIPIASVWVYDRKLVPDRSNLTFENERAYMLQMIADANRALHAENKSPAKFTGPGLTLPQDRGPSVALICGQIDSR